MSRSTSWAWRAASATWSVFVTSSRSGTGAGSAEAVDMGWGGGDERDMDAPCDGMVVVGLRESEVPQNEKLSVLLVSWMSSSLSTTASAVRAVARSGTRRVTWSNMVA